MVHLQTFLGENLGDGKEKAVEFQSLCFCSGDWLLRSLLLATLNAFPLCSPRALTLGFERQPQRHKINFPLPHRIRTAAAAESRPRGGRMGRKTKGLEDWLRIDAKLVCADISQTIFRCCEATLHIHNTLQTSLPRRNTLNEAPIHEKEKAVENQPLCFVVDRGFEPLCPA